MKADQSRPDTLDISVTLRQVMAGRGLTVSDVAQMAGVSKSAMEKYLAGPSSPRAIAILRLAEALGVSVDRIVRGELELDVEIANQVAFSSFGALIRDLKVCPDLAQQFASLDASSQDFSDFVRDVAYERGVQFRHKLATARKSAQGQRVVVG